ncbi:MAG: aminopeptidase P family protein [Actinobacteria bacterium]|nr:aminopeptidase P family protein [Actinomycetota bacterium]
MRPRFERARTLAAGSGLAGLYVTAGPNFRWLTGESAHPGGWPLWLSALLVPVDGEPALVVSEMHARIFDLDRLPVQTVLTYVDGQDPGEALRRGFAAAGLDGETVGVEDSLWFADANLLATAVPAVRLRRASRVFDRLRAVKDAGEIEHLRLAAVAHDAGYRRAVEVLRPGVTVAHAGSEIVRAMLEAGSESLEIAGAFHDLTDRRFETGEIVDVDLFPGSHGGYRADTARNVFLGAPSDEARRLYEATLHAYDAAVAAVRPGVSAESIHIACAAAMSEAGYEQVWKVGHGVGLGDAHEPPLLQLENDDPIEEGMVFTIDPGAFIARNTPIHVEDMVVVTATGCEALNTFTRELTVV